MNDRHVARHYDMRYVKLDNKIDSHSVPSFIEMDIDFKDMSNQCQLLCNTSLKHILKYEN